MTMPLSFTSSRYAAAAARRSLERTSVVSIITYWPIHASGILSSESAALGLSLSIIVRSSNLSWCKCRIPVEKDPRTGAATGYILRMEEGEDEVRFESEEIHIIEAWD